MTTAQDALTVQLEYFDFQWVKMGQIKLGQQIIQVSDDDPVAMLSESFSVLHHCNCCLTLWPPLSLIQRCCCPQGEVLLLDGDTVEDRVALLIIGGGKGGAMGLQPHLVSRVLHRI